MISIERKYELALDRIYVLEQRYMDLKAENALLKDEIKELYEEIEELKEHERG